MAELQTDDLFLVTGPYFDYNKDGEIYEFGKEIINKQLLSKIEQLTNAKLHHLLRRNIFSAHRDLHKLLKQYENGNKFYLHIEGVAGPMHLGHMIPFLMAKYLSENFNVPCIIQITSKSSLSLIESNSIVMENIKSIIAMGFDVKKTFIFKNKDYINEMYHNICLVQNKINVNSINNIFGYYGQTINELLYPTFKIVSAFSSTFKNILGSNYKNMSCLIVGTVDQDPTWRLCRDVAPKLNEKKCCCLYSKFPPLLKRHGPMVSSSSSKNVIFLNDTFKEMKKKINGAFTGSQDNRKQQMEHGTNLDIDVPYQYLRYFMEDDDELNIVAKFYEKGQIPKQMLEIIMNGYLRKECFSYNIPSGIKHIILRFIDECFGGKDIKRILCCVLIPFIEQFQNKKAKISDDVVEAFMKVRLLEC
eukprot:265251_1